MQAIQEEIKRKEKEGIESNPFTRRKCNPRMVTKTHRPEDAITSDMLRQLAERQEKENRERLQAVTNNVEINVNASKRKQHEVDARKHVDVTDGEGVRQNGQGKEDRGNRKRPKLASGGSNKEDLFDAHNFDIEIDVDTSLIGGSVAAAVNAPNSSSKPIGGPPSKDTGPTKRSLNLSDYKKKRGLI